MNTFLDRWRTPRSAVVTPATTVVVENPGEIRARLDDAYDKGRHDEARRHRSHPIITLALVLIAAVGAVVVFYAVREGSFSRGGAVVDSKLAVAASDAGPAISNAAQTAGPKLQQAADKAGAVLKTDTQAAADKTRALADKAVKPN